MQDILGTWDPIRLRNAVHVLHDVQQAAAELTLACAVIRKDFLDCIIRPQGSGLVSYGVRKKPPLAWEFNYIEHTFSMTSGVI
jgi:hypothetical protein